MPRGDSPRVNARAQRELPSRYSKLLEKVAGGHALFKPQSVILPERGGRIGDGGYIEKGLFVWLFNVFDRPPDGLPRLEWSEADDVVIKPEHNSGVLQSSTTSSVQFHATIGTEASTLPAGVPPMHIDPEVTLQESAFAFLAFAGADREVKVLKRPRRAKVKAWLARHYEELYTLYEGDIVIICETVGSSGWVGGLAHRETSEASADIQLGVPGVAELGIGFRGSRGQHVGFISTKGPDPDGWSPGAPPIYTVVVGLVAARRQVSARLLRKLFALCTPQKPHRPTSGQEGNPGTFSSYSPQGSAHNSSAASGSSAPVDSDAMDVVETVEDDSGAEDDSGDHILLHRILDRALEEDNSADLAVGDWSLITDFTTAYGIEEIDLDPDSVHCYVDRMKGPGRAAVLNVVRLALADEILDEDLDVQLPNTVEHRSEESSAPGWQPGGNIGRGAPADSAFMSPAFQQEWHRRTEARKKVICARNPAGNTLCAWHEICHEPPRIPPRRAAQGVLNCGCSEEEALFEDSLARNGVGSCRPAGNAVRMDPSLRKPLLELLKRRYGYKDGDFEIDITLGTWREEEDSVSWENRVDPEDEAPDMPHNMSDPLETGHESSDSNAFRVTTLAPGWHVPTLAPGRHALTQWSADDNSPYSRWNYDGYPQ